MKETTEEGSSTQSSTPTSLENSSSEEDLNLPLRLERELTKKPEELTLTLPSKKIPELLAGTNTVTKTNTRNELKIVSTLLKAGGDISDASCSVSTIYRQRKAAVNSKAEEIRGNIRTFKYIKSTDDGCFLVLHWGGKIIQVLSGQTEDRFAIVVNSPNTIPGQFIASPAIADGTGETMAEYVYRCIEELELLDNVDNVVFDTTASHTGKWSGSATRFEAKLKWSLLWLACRHHIPELFIKHASTTVRGPSKGPDDSLFKEFKEQFSDEKSLWKWPTDVHDWRFQKASEILQWADNHMKNATWP